MIHFTVQAQDAVHALLIPKPPALEAAINVLIEKAKKKHNGHINLRLDLPHRVRTTGKHSQNNCIHGWESWICQHTGDDVDDFHIWICRRAFRRGYPPKRNDRGEIVFSKLDGEPLPMSTADASIEQAQMILEELKITAAEESIKLPEYDEEGRIVYR